MHATLTPITPADREALVDIFNGHVSDGFAAYPESPVPYAFFDHMMQAVGDYPTVAARSESGALLGFGFLRPWHPLPTFDRVAEISYFLRPEATRQGVGHRMLERLLEAARDRGLTSILANVSSLNEGSLRFHLQNGFQECGRFVAVARKNGRVFDAVWFQKQL